MELVVNGNIRNGPPMTSAVIALQEKEQPADQRYVHLHNSIYNIINGNFIFFFSQRANELKRQVKVPLLISVSYTASIGGAGTLIGSGSPLAFKGILEE